MSVKKKIILFTDWYMPAYKAGGPIQSCKNLVQLLKDTYEIYIITSDRDLGDQHAFENVSINQWQKLDPSVSIIYLSPSHQNVSNYINMIQEVKAELVYLNSMFSPAFTIKPLLAFIKLKNRPKLILAPRGMLRKGAIKYKYWKKLPFIKLLKWLPLSNKIVFHATDEQEMKDIQYYFPNSEKYLISNVPNLSFNSELQKKNKTKGQLKLVYLSRVSSIKNIHQLLEWLNKYPLEGKWSLDIYGLPESVSFGDLCKSLSTNLPVNWMGGIESHLVPNLLSKYDVFILPTKGENFGHAIFEAFSVGLPVVISDQTPWKDLEKRKVGFDLPLDQPQQFINSLQFFLDMENAQYQEWSASSISFSKNYIKQSSFLEKYTSLFSV